MSRIDSENVNFGKAYVLPTSDEQLKTQEIVDAKNVAADVLSRAKNQAEAIIEEAKRNAQKYMDEEIAKAKASVAQITEEARQEGYKQGYDEGNSAVKQDLIAQIENLDKFARSEFEIKNRIIKSAHYDIIDLVLAIAQSVCKKELQIDNRILYNITKVAINSLNDKETVKIFVNPNMAQKIYDISESLKKDILSLQSIKIVEDASVSEDGTIVESISSRVDNRITSQIDVISQKLLTELQTFDETRLVAEIEAQCKQIGNDQ